MIGVEIICFESYSDLFDESVTFDELCVYLGIFSRDSVLWVCSYVNVALQLWNSDGSDSPNLLFLLRAFFPAEMAIRLYSRHLLIVGEKRVVFHRRQLLFIAKLALIHCKNSGVNASVQTKAFGICFLLANDHFHFDIMPQGIKPETAKDDLARIIAEMLASVEYGQLQIPNVFVRSREMCQRIPNELLSDPDYCDIGLLFKEAHHLELSHFFYLVFGIASRFGENLSNGLQAKAWTLPMRNDDFSNTKADGKAVSRFFEIVAATPTIAALHPSLRRADSGPRSKWASDSSVFRQFPVIQQWFGTGTSAVHAGFILLDHPFLFQKVITEPYFTGMRTAGQKFSRFWGKVFEKYVHQIFLEAIKTKGGTYIQNPSLRSSPNEELCDGAIVDGSTVILLEFKSSIIRADKKYNGDATSLTDELVKKFVYNSKDGKPKAVVQLANAVKVLFGGEYRGQVEWCDIETITRCYVLTITLDTIGAAIGISTFLDVYFKEAISETVTKGIELRPFYCTDIETLEIISGTLEVARLADILERWFQVNPPLATPLVGIERGEFVISRPGWIWDRWEAICDEGLRFLFGEIPPEAKSAKQKRRLESRLAVNGKKISGRF